MGRVQGINGDLPQMEDGAGITLNIVTWIHVPVAVFRAERLILFV